MKLSDIVSRDPDPEPWSEVAKIPWDDPDFSRRMLAEHLSQEHDAASRRFTIIDRQVEWIHQQILNQHASDILDLGCGPGFYCKRLARLGHRCTGIDFGPASIAYARSRSDCVGGGSRYILSDLRETEFGAGRDLVMLLFGEFNVFSRTDALGILRRAHQALTPSGRLLLEVHMLESIRARGDVAPSWSSSERGLFSDRPYIRLDDAVWRANEKAAIERHYVIDAATGNVSLFGSTTQAYTPEKYEALLREAGFSSLDWNDDWPVPEPAGEFKLLVAGR